MRYVGLAGKQAGIAVAAALLAVVAQSFTAGSTAGGAPVSSLAAGKAKLAAGQVGPAVKLLEAAVKANPTNCDAHLCLGQAYTRCKEYAKAKLEFRAAIRCGRGSATAQKANTCLMSLPKNLIAPRSGPGTALIARATGIFSVERGTEPPKPTVIDFYASWAQPCKLLKPAMEKARAEYGDRVNFLMVNVDDPNSEDIVDKYEVSPIPTLVFLKADGEVATFSVGFSGEGSVERGIEKILPSG